MHFEIVHTASYFLFLLLFSSTATFAQFWESTGGPESNSFYGMHVTANGSIFTISNAVHRSVDHGSHWMLIQKAQSIVKPFIQIASSRDSFLYLLTNTALLRSHDDGASWTQLRFVNGTSFAVSASGLIVMGTMDSLLVSVDRGETWSGTVLPLRAELMKVSVDMDDVVYTSDSHYLYRSTNKGRTLMSVMDGLSYGYVPRHLVSVKHGTTIGAIDDQIYLSADSGRVWSKGHRAPYMIQSIAAAGGDSLYMLMANFTMELSTDGGNTWKSYGRTMPDSSSPYSMEIHVSNGYLYARTDGEIYCSPLDTSSPWTRLVVPNGNVYGIVPTSDGVVHALATRDVNTASARSRFWRLGAKWQPEFASEFTKVNAVSADSSGRFFAMLARTIIRSDDWQHWSEGTTLSNGTKFQFAHSSQSTYLASDLGGMFRSTDVGVNWDDINIGILDQRLFSVAVTDSMVYAGGIARFYRSTNNGSSWEEPLFPFISGSGNVNAISAVEAEVIVGVELTGVYFSSDHGTLWRNHSKGLALDTILQLISTPSGVVFALATSGIYAYSRASETWSTVMHEITANVLSIALGFDGRIYVGTDGDGVYRSTETYGIGGTGSVHTSASKTITLHPVPASDQVTIHFTNEIPLRYEVGIFNLLGGEVLASHDTDVIDIEGLVAGQYFIRITADGATQTLPLTIVK